jgi:predicted transcriptional regulator
MSDNLDRDDAARAVILEYASDIVSAYVSNNPIKKSITDDFLICLEDGKKFKSLKRHLRSKYGMSPEEYREKWGLPYDYPMVAPSYARKRSALAKEMGLGKLEK